MWALKLCSIYIARIEMHAIKSAEVNAAGVLNDISNQDIQFCPLSGYNVQQILLYRQICGINIVSVNAS